MNLGRKVCGNMVELLVEHICMTLFVDAKWEIGCISSNHRVGVQGEA
jgi:hypothetical protein